jgi:Predicted transcriptional regulator
MFERDKDDLRSLGIEIEVGSYDPLFNDEAGYRIKQEKYQLDLGQITPTEISLLSLAAQAWQGASFDEAAQKALLKLNSIGVPSDSLTLPGASNKLSDGGRDFPLIAKAIAEQQLLTFTYIDSQLFQNVRKIVPIGLSSRAGFWYLSGVDQEIQEIRTFRVDRIEGEIAASKGPRDFETPQNFDPKGVFEGGSPTSFASIDVRKGKGTSLRALATSTESLGEWDRLRVPIYNLHTLASMVLWHGNDVFVQQPQELREILIGQLDSLVKSHG